MKPKKLSFKEKLLLILHFSDNKKSNITRLMKLHFLFQEVLKMKASSKSENLSFIPHRYGAWAVNFDVSVLPLLVSGAVSFEEIGDNKIYSIIQDKEEEISEIVEKIYLVDYKDETKMIRFFTENYSRESEYVGALIQLSYFLRPDSANHSEIKEKIKKLDISLNQKIFIDFIDSAPDNFITFMFENVNVKGILQLFKINRDNPEFPSFTVLFNEFHLYLNDSEIFKTQNFITQLNKIVIDSKSKTYEPLIMALLSIFSILKIEWKKHYRQILLFLFKSLSLEWPLLDEDFNIFNMLLIEFKQNTGFNTFFETISDLTANELISTINLTDEILKSKSFKLKNKKIKKELFEHTEIASYEPEKLEVNDLRDEEDEEDRKNLSELVEIEEEEGLYNMTKGVEKTAS